jgi:TatD DNase family protein
MQLIDTHVHLNLGSFQPDLKAVAQNWREAGVIRLVHSCVEPAEFEAIQAIANCFPELFFAVGLHPLDVDKWSSNSASEMLCLAQSDRRVVAIGETGLDFYKAENRKQQKTVFQAQLKLAQQLNLPVIVHCREAAAEMAELLYSFWATQGAVRGVMHCWSGSPEEANWFLDLGFYLSFSGIVTFKNATQVQESAKMVPNDRLLIETDCPFLAPVPKRKEGRNQPAYVRYVAEQVAQLRQVPLEAIAAQTTANACSLFNFSSSEAETRIEVNIDASKRVPAL